MRYILVFSVFFCFSKANACVIFDEKEYWNSSEIIAVGLVSGASLEYDDGYPFVTYTLTDSLILKGKVKSSKVFTVKSDAFFSPLKVGKTFIVFVGEGMRVDYCGPSKIFEKKWLDKSVVVEDEEEMNFVDKVRMLRSRK